MHVHCLCMAVVVAGQTARGQRALWVLHQPPSASPSAVFLHTPGSMHNTPLLMYLLGLLVSLSARPRPDAQTLVFYILRARLYPSLPSERCRERHLPPKPSLGTPRGLLAGPPVAVYAEVAPSVLRGL